MMCAPAFHVPLFRIDRGGHINKLVEIDGRPGQQQRRREMIDNNIPLEHWIELARRDDWHRHFVGSDIRRMLGEIERLQHAKRAALKIADERSKENVELKAEIAKLQADQAVWVTETQKAHKELQAEIERLQPK